MEREITLDGKIVKLKCNALSPRIYRHKFGRDIITDVMALRAHFAEATKQKEADASMLSAEDIEMFENLAWLFQWQAAPDEIPDTPEQWLDGIEGMFSVYTVLPEILKLWNDSQKTTSTPKN